MGCVCVKPAVLKDKASGPPGFGFSAKGSGKYSASFRTTSDFEKAEGEGPDRHQSMRKLKKGSYDDRNSFTITFSPGRFMEAEQTAAGWPSWLSAVASEATHGWIPLKPDCFERLEKIGQGTYSSVFKAREVKTGKLVALKKVRFDSLQPDSIRFMSREIAILRRIDHPNVIKLEGIITSQLSRNIYLVFEYMEHDLAGLLSNPDILFTDAQIKCYMKQLLMGIEHCHISGIIHRDIKASNILVNNKGVLKVADFGLANVLNTKKLTSRVVTLWYRPPELLMGSTNYDVSVDLWSVGCLFAELLFRKPLLRGRTEVEQLHKILKLCGSPSDDFWKTSKIRRSAIFKPQHSYESSLREKCRGIASSAMDLLETFLSVEPEKRGTASSALLSNYFKTTPYACDPSSLPQYVPNKEIDAVFCKELKRSKNQDSYQKSDIMRKQMRVRKALQEPCNIGRFTTNEEVQHDNCLVRRNYPEEKGVGRDRLMPLYDTFSGISNFSNYSRMQRMVSGPKHATTSSNFSWVKKLKDDQKVKRSNSRFSSRSRVSALEQSSVVVEPESSGQSVTSACELSRELSVPNSSLCVPKH